MEEEIWRDVVGYEGLYMVSSTGRVKSIDRYVKGKNCLNKRLGVVLKQSLTIHGYYYVGLFKNGKGRGCVIHRLVGCAFLSNPENKTDINHIDGNKKNNRVENLEWCTHLENVYHYYYTINKRKPNPDPLFPRKGSAMRIPIIQKDKEGNIIDEFESIASASRKLNLCPNLISRICNKANKSDSYFFFEFKN